jgi:hypothetical protein
MNEAVARFHGFLGPYVALAGMGTYTGWADFSET